MTPTTNTESHAARPASVIALLAGIWFFVSPWIYGAYTVPNAWNSWIVGALMFIVSLICLNETRSTGVSWLNVIFGVWAFVSPWIYGYTGNNGRFINSLCVGVVVFVAALVATNATMHGNQMTQQHR